MLVGVSVGVSVLVEVSVGVLVDVGVMVGVAVGTAWSPNSTCTVLLAVTKKPTVFAVVER